MLELNYEKQAKLLILKTDDDSVRYLLEVTTRKTEYIPWQRKVGTVIRTYKVYEKRSTAKGITTYLIRTGWTAYILNTFISRISKETYDNILKEVIYSDSLRRFPFPGLRDYQNEDALHLLKYRYGLHSCFTGYGRPEDILK